MTASLLTNNQSLYGTFNDTLPLQVCVRTTRPCSVKLECYDKQHEQIAQLVSEYIKRSTKLECSIPKDTYRIRASIDDVFGTIWTAPFLGVKGLELKDNGQVTGFDFALHTFDTIQLK